MAPIKLPCPDTSCDYITVEVEIADGLKLLEMHERVAHRAPVPAPANQTVKSEQLVMKDGYVTEEAFSYFVHSWNEYKQQHLAKCLGEEVSTLLYGKFGPEGYDAMTEAGCWRRPRGWSWRP